jgi:hypothetical protein
MGSRVRRFISPSLFALVVLSFALPFATVSCDSATTTFTGIQLVTRTVPRGGVVDEAPDCSTSIGVCVERAGSTPATIALLAALVGLALGLLGMSKGPGWCAGVCVLALLVVFFRAFASFADVHFLAGFQLALLLAFVACALHIRRAWRRRRSRPKRPLATHLVGLGCYLLTFAALSFLADVPGWSRAVELSAAAWLMFAVAPTWSVVAVLLWRWSRQGRSELPRHAARLDALLWLGPVLVLGLRSGRLRAFLIPPAPLHVQRKSQKGVTDVLEDRSGARRRALARPDGG